MILLQVGIGRIRLSMALCLKIINLHRGALKIDSKLGEGTVMRVVFPVEANTGRKKGTKEGRRVKKAEQV